MAESHREMNLRQKDHVCVQDIRKYLFNRKYDVCILNLMLMFLPYHDQEIILKVLLKKMSRFGILIFVEKNVTGFGDGFFRYAMDRLTMYLKHKQGIEKEKILEKELSLIGIQRPIRAIKSLEGFRVFEWFQISKFFWNGHHQNIVVI